MLWQRGISCPVSTTQELGGNNPGNAYTPITTEVAGTKLEGDELYYMNRFNPPPELQVLRFKTQKSVVCEDYSHWLTLASSSSQVIAPGKVKTMLTYSTKAAKGDEHRTRATAGIRRLCLCPSPF